MDNHKHVNLEMLLYVRQKITDFVRQNDLVILPVVKFLVMMTVLLLMNWHLGYRYMLMRWILVILVSLVCSILPWQGITALSTIYLLGHVSALSIEGALVLLLVILICALVQYLFLPGGAVLIALVPLAFYLKIPYMIPLLAGIFGGPLTFISVESGVVVYYLMNILEKNAGALLNPGNNLMSNFLLLANSFKDKQLYVVLVAFALVTLFVYGVSRIHLDYARPLAVSIGGVVMILVYLIGGYSLSIEEPYVKILAGIVVCTLAAVFVTFWSQILDYSCTEYLEYEDDDYVYYVKAVPKIRIAEPERKIHDIGSMSSHEDEDIEEVAPPEAAAFQEDDPE